MVGAARNQGHGEAGVRRYNDVYRKMIRVCQPSEILSYCLLFVGVDVEDQRAGKKSTLIFQVFNLLDYLKMDIPVWFFYP